MRRVTVVLLAAALVAGMLVNVASTGARAATPGTSENGILILDDSPDGRKQFGRSTYYYISASAGFLRVSDSCDLDRIVGGDEVDPIVEEYEGFFGNEIPEGVWHSIRSDHSYRWLTDTKSDEASSSVAIADLDDDGTQEVVGGTTSGRTLEAMNADTGEFVWTFPNPPTNSSYTPGEWHASPAVADIDPMLQGREVVELHTYTSTAYMFKGVMDGINYGTRLVDHVNDPNHALSWWKDLYDKGELGDEGLDWDIIWVADLRTIGGEVPTVEQYLEFSSPAIADVDADGDLDIVTASRNGYVYVIDGRSGSFLSWFPVGKTSASVAVANVNDDPQLEIFVGNEESQTSFRALRWNADRTPPGLEQMWNFNIPENSGIVSSASVGDIDADGSLEIVFGSRDGNVRSLDAVTHALEWETPTGGPVNSSPAFAGRSSVNRWEMTWPFFRGNVFRTGYLPSSKEEMGVYIGSNDGYLYLLSGTNGEMIDRFVVDDGHDVQASPVLGDIDGDNKIEVQVLTTKPSEQGGGGGGGGTSPPPPEVYPAFWSIKDNGSYGPEGTDCGEPVADFGWWPLRPMEGQEIKFTDLSYDTMGEIVEWNWDFHHPGYPGGGPYSSDQNPTHIYGDNGFFQVTLTVWDDDNNSASVTKTVEVVNADPTLEVWLSALIAGQQRTHGYWKHQCWIEDNNLQSEEHPGISPFVEFIREHSLVWANTNKEEICADLNNGEGPGHTMLQALRMQLIALWLNVASNKLYLDSPLDHPDTLAKTIGEFLQEAEQAILSGNESQYERLKTIADNINNDASIGRYVSAVAGLYTARATDPGSDDLTFEWQCDATTVPVVHQYFNNGIGPDPYPSPDGIFPFTVEDSVVCKYVYSPTPHLPDLTVTDDDGGKAKDVDPIQAWSADFEFDWALELRDIGYGFVVVYITVTYIDWDPVVVPLDPVTREPLFGPSGPGEGGKSGGEGVSGSGGMGGVSP